jgi:hypothetical protein
VYTFLAQFDWQGRMKYSYHYPRIMLNFPNQSFLNLYAYVDFMKLLEDEFGPRRGATHGGAFAGAPERSTVYRGFSIEAGTTPVKQLIAYANADLAWNAFDYDLGSGPRFPRVSPAALENPDAPFDPGTGRTLDIKITLTYQPSDVLRLSVDYIKSRLFRYDTRRVAFDQNVLFLGTTYQFSRFSFVRVRAEYESLLSNLKAQLLLGWTPNPGTALYIGYSDDFNYDGNNPLTRQYEPGLHRNRSTLFAKLSYDFRATID